MLIGIVTGAGRGIGREIIRALDARELDEIWAIFENKNALQALFASVNTPIRVLNCNLYDVDALAAIKEELKESHPTVKYLIHTEGLFEKENPVIEEESACRGVVALTEIVKPYMKKDARIIFTAQKYKIGERKKASFLASQAFVYAYGRALHASLKSKGINVTTVLVDRVNANEKTARRALRAVEANLDVLTPTWQGFFGRIFNFIMPTKILLRM